MAGHRGCFSRRHRFGKLTNFYLRLSRHFRSFVFQTLVLVCCLSGMATAVASEFAKRLTDGQHVLLIRHAHAPGVGDPPGYSLEDCTTQRNLGEQGRRQAVQIGSWLKQQGIQAARLYSSPWCRCRDTAELLGLGRVTVEASLGSFFNDMARAGDQTARLKTFIAQRMKDDSKAPIILVTHHVNIEAYTGRVVSVGDMVLARVGPGGDVRSIELYPSPTR